MNVVKGGCILGSIWLTAWAIFLVAIWIIAHVVASAF